MDLDKTDMLQLLSYLEGELQARDIVVAILQAEKVKRLVAQIYEGDIKTHSSDPLLSLQGDSDFLGDTNFGENDVKLMYDDQLIQLENLITTQHRTQKIMHDAVTFMEKKYHKICYIQNYEKEKHQKDMEEEDNITYKLEKERERLQKQLEEERNIGNSLAKKIKKASLIDQEEKQKQEYYKMLAVQLIKDQTYVMRKMGLLQTLSDGLESKIHCQREETEKIRNTLKSETNRMQHLEANYEMKYSECDFERERLTAQYLKREEEEKLLMEELELLRQIVERKSIQLSELLEWENKYDNSKNENYEKHKYMNNEERNDNTLNDEEDLSFENLRSLDQIFLSGMLKNVGNKKIESFSINNEKLNECLKEDIFNEVLELNEKKIIMNSKQNNDFKMMKQNILLNNHLDLEKQIIMNKDKMITTINENSSTSTNKMPELKDNSFETINRINEQQINLIDEIENRKSLLNLDRNIFLTQKIYDDSNHEVDLISNDQIKSNFIRDDSIIDSSLQRVLDNFNKNYSNNFENKINFKISSNSIINEDTKPENLQIDPETSQENLILVEKSNFVWKNGLSDCLRNGELIDIVSTDFNDDTNNIAEKMLASNQYQTRANSKIINKFSNNLPKNQSLNNSFNSKLKASSIPISILQLNKNLDSSLKSNNNQLPTNIDIITNNISNNSLTKPKDSKINSSCYIFSSQIPIATYSSKPICNNNYQDSMYCVRNNLNMSCDSTNKSITPILPSYQCHIQQLQIKQNSKNCYYGDALKTEKSNNLLKSTTETYNNILLAESLASNVSINMDLEPTSSIMISNNKIESLICHPDLTGDINTVKYTHHNTNLESSYQSISQDFQYHDSHTYNNQISQLFYGSNLKINSDLEKVIPKLTTKQQLTIISDISNSLVCTPSEISTNSESKLKVANNSDNVHIIKRSIYPVIGVRGQPPPVPPNKPHITSISSQVPYNIYSKFNK